MKASRIRTHGRGRGLRHPMEDKEAESDYEDEDDSQQPEQPPPTPPAPTLVRD
jgi:hypothetical protein